MEVSGEQRFETIGAGHFHACGVTGTGDLHCWGRAGFQSTMGDPTLPYMTLVEEPRLAPADIAFVSVDVGVYHTCGVAVDGSARCMGSGWGLGQGIYSIERSRPVAVAPPGPLPRELDAIDF